MSTRISHAGIGTGNGITFMLAVALMFNEGLQANFTHYQKLARRTANQGEIDLCDGSSPAVGVIVSASPKGDAVTIEQDGFESVRVAEAVVVGDLVTPSTDGAKKGLLMKLPAVVAFDATANANAGNAGAVFASQVAREAARKAGIWEVDAIKVVDGNDCAVINLSKRL